MTSRDFCGTLNNYSEADYDDLVAAVEQLMANGTLVSAVLGQERGLMGTDHIQAFFQFSNSQRVTGVKVHLRNPTWHLEARRGTPKQAWDYCTKEGRYTSFGELRDRQGQGKRNDLEDFRDLIRRGATELDLAEHSFGTWARNYKALNRYRFLLKAQNKQFRKLDVEVIWGPAGSGKTRYAVESCATLEEDYFMLNEPDAALWWDGYSGQRVLILDDFTGWVKLALLLKLLDGYPLRLDIKGGHTSALWDKVFITSNIPPNSWYKPEAMARHPNALNRRLHSIKRLETTGQLRLTDADGVVLTPLEQWLQ